MFAEEIEKLAEENDNFRKVLCTGSHSQVVLMSILVGQDIGEEVHPNVDQILFIVEGKAEAILNGESRTVDEDSLIFVPAGTTHNIKNVGDEDLKLFTVYSPPEHPEGTVHKTKEEAEKGEGA